MEEQDKHPLQLLLSFCSCWSCFSQLQCSHVLSVFAEILLLPYLASVTCLIFTVASGVVLTKRGVGFSSCVTVRDSVVLVTT